MIVHEHTTDAAAINLSDVPELSPLLESFRSNFYKGLPANLQYYLN